MSASPKKSLPPKPHLASEWKVGFFLSAICALAMLFLSLSLASGSSQVLRVAWLFVSAFLIGGLLVSTWFYRVCSGRWPGGE